MPKFAFKRSAEFQTVRRPSIGSSVIYTHMDAGIVIDEVHFGDMHASLASGRKFLVKTVPSMAKAIYRKFNPDLRARDRWRKQQVAGLTEARKEAMQKVSEQEERLDGHLGLMPVDGNAQTGTLGAVSVIAIDHESINEMAMLSTVDEEHLTTQQQAERQTVIIDNRSKTTSDLEVIPYFGPQVAEERVQPIHLLQPLDRRPVVVAVTKARGGAAVPRPADITTGNLQILDADLGPQVAEVRAQPIHLLQPLDRHPVVVTIPKAKGGAAAPRPADITTRNSQFLDASPAKWLGGKVGRKRDHVTRDNPISSIANQEGNAAFGTDNDTASSEAEFQQYINAFNVARSNVSDLIFPFLDTILANTNSSIVYDAAWSIYSDLTGSSPYVMGPFFHGMNCIEWIEDQLALNGTNITSPSMNATENLARLEYLAVHQVLLELYDYAYHGAASAINQTGLMEDMLTLAQYFAPTDASVFPPGYSTYTEPTYDASYFMVYNETMSPDVTFSDVMPKG